MTNFSYLENKNEQVWMDLDDDAYNNHFSNGQCYVAVQFYDDIKSGEYHSIRTLPIYPEEVSFKNNANYNTADILGRPGQISNYTSTSDITTNFSLHLHRELKVSRNAFEVSVPSYVEYNGVIGERWDSRTYDDVVGNDINDIDDIVRFIMACNYPKNYTTGGIFAPIVTYKFGDTQIIGKQTSWDIKWCGPKIGNIYMECFINLGVTHVFPYVPYFDKVRQIRTPRMLP